MDYIEATISGIITALCLVIAMYVALKTHKIEEIITNSVENVLSDVSTDETLQKNLYQMGGILGNGVKAGVGLTKGSGKFSLNNMLMSLAGRYLGLSNTENDNKATSTIP